MISLYHMSDLKLPFNGVIWWIHQILGIGWKAWKWKKLKKKSRSKKKWCWDHLSYMCKSNSGRSLPGVEPKPKKKRVEETHSGTRKLHRDLDFDEAIHQWEVSSISSVNSEASQNSCFLKNGRKKKAPSLGKSLLRKKKEGSNRHIDFFLNFYFLNRMHPKVRVRFLRDTILS